MIRFLLLSFSVAAISAIAADSNSDTVTEIKKHRPEVTECHNHFLDEGTGEKGAVVLKWKINEQGKPEDVEVDAKQTTLKNKTLQNCLVDLVKSITFSEAEAGKTKKTSYRFTFQ